MSTVAEAWAAVMADVRGLGKNNQANAGGVRFNFRGVDDVMNLVGPVLRDAAVSVIPMTAEVVADREVLTSASKIMRNVTVRIGWLIVGPEGDTISGASLGEASDSGDKAVSKAHSVAYRTFLIQALCLPTNDEDPDHTIHDRQRPTQASSQGDQAQAALDALLDAVRGADDMDKLTTLYGQAKTRGALKWAGVEAAFEARKSELQA